MRAFIFLAALAIMGFGGWAHAQTGPLTDSQFVEKAAGGNRFEIEASKLAQQRAQDPRLKQFADIMVADHGKALAALEPAAKRASAALPPQLDKPHQAKLDALAKHEGASFDAAYKADMVAGHAQTMLLLLDYEKQGKTDSLKSWVGTVLPTVRRHRDMINAM